MKRPRRWATEVCLGWVFLTATTSTIHGTTSSPPKNNNYHQNVLHPLGQLPNRIGTVEVEAEENADGLLFDEVKTVDGDEPIILPPPPPQSSSQNKDVHDENVKETPNTLEDEKRSEKKHYVPPPPLRTTIYKREDAMAEETEQKREEPLQQLKRPDPPGEALVVSSDTADATKPPPPKVPFRPPPPLQETVSPLEHPPTQRKQPPTERHEQQGPTVPNGQPNVGVSSTYYGYPHGQFQPYYQQQSQQQPLPQQQSLPQQQQQQQQQQPLPQQQQQQAPSYGYSLAPQGPQGPFQRPQPGRRSRPPAWKRLWRRIEGGLDSLADLEDAVAGRANKLYSATVETASSAMETASSAIKSKTSSSNQEDEDDSDFEPETTTPTLPSRVSRFKLGQQKPKAAAAPQQPVQSITARHEMMRQQHLQQQQPTNTTNRPILAANGGASSLPGGPPPQQSNSQQQQTDAQAQTGYPQGAGGTPPMTPAAKAQELHRKEVQAMLQRRPAATTTMTHPQAHLSQMMATPYDTNPSGRRPPPQRMPRPRPVHDKHDDDDDDDDDSVGWGDRLGRFIPRLPSFKFLRSRQRSHDEYAATMDAWSAEDGENEEPKGFFMSFVFGGKRRGKHSDGGGGGGVASSRASKERSVTPTVSALMDRCEQKDSLLKSFERQKCKQLGRKRAFFDVVALLLILRSYREFVSFDSVLGGSSSSSGLFRPFTSVGEKLGEEWFLYTTVGALLAVATNQLVLEHASSQLASSVRNQVSREAQYGSLFLRLVSSASTEQTVVDQVGETSHSQTLASIEWTRLKTFVTCLLVTLVAMTLSFVPPLLLAAADVVANVATLSEWHSWPVQWQKLGTGIADIFKQFAQFVSSTIGEEVKHLSQQPYELSYSVALFVLMLLITRIPGWELGKKVQALFTDDDAEGLQQSHGQQMDKVANLGTSSATRLPLMSKMSSLEQSLERWRTAMPTPTQQQDKSTSVNSLLEIVWYGALAGLILCLPLLLYARGVDIPTHHLQVDNLVNWNSLVEVSIALFYTHALFLSAIGRAVDVSMARRWIVKFLADFPAAVRERTRQLTAPPANLELQASISPTAGITVRDLWAAHATRRAWAVRGASLFCRSGEVVLILGDDGAGKSRLLTTLAEAILSPPKQAQTVNRVRGSVSVGNLDVHKWDPNQLRNRVGLMLNDVRTVADFAQALSGLTLEEILEPSDGLRSLDASPGSSARACMLLALKMTGLYSTLLAKLPSKLSTVVTGNEEDLNPSPLRPHYTVLSPVEWSKLLMARVLCQAILDNENAASSNDKVENSLLGSVLLLDDATVQFSEAEESRFVRDLRLSAASTILTSNRWSMGRWADRVVVLRDGAIVETGSHNELLNRGPQQSLYAAKWHAMTSA